MNKKGEYQGTAAPADPYSAGGGGGGAGGSDAYGPAVPETPYADPGAPAAGGGFPVVPVVGGLVVLGGLAAFLMSRKKAA